MSKPADQKLEIQHATDIVGLIGEQIALKPQGREFVGLCPFHDDKKPSLHVSPVKQIYKCFSCGAGGDVFSFMMNYHKLTFPEALAHLAQRAGIELVRLSRSGARGATEEGASEGGGSGGDRQLIAQANQRALLFFQKQFQHPQQGQGAREYTQARGITPEMIEAFQVGYAPDQWDGLVQSGQGGGVKGLELAGLASARKSGDGFYDRFRHRLMFPIFDALGRPIAFGARRLREQDEPKYLNSPETALFNKSATLYGLHLAKQSIVASQAAVVVEGYTDVIACHQAGFRNVVATLGTALTRQHVTALSRLCERVVLVFDADAAGQKAADRAVEVFLTGLLDVTVAVPPPGEDPAQLLAGSDGAQRFQSLLDHGVDALEYKFTRLTDQLEQSDTITGRQRLAEQFLQDLIALGVLGQQAIRRAMIVRRLAQLLSIHESAVESQLKKLAASRPKFREPAPAAAHDDPSGHVAAENNFQNEVAWPDRAHKIRALQLAEQQIIGCLLRRPALFHQTLSNGMALDEALTPGEMITPEAKQLYAFLYQQLSGNPTVTLAQLLAELASEAQHGLAGIATHAEAQADALCGEDEDSLTQMLVTSVQSLLEYHQEHQYQQKRQAVFGLGGQAQQQADETDTDTLLRELSEHRRNSPSPARIARVGRG